ncbi:hypothetical protein DTO006G1_3368 [Penicillium roqueforti]|uniref:uncharacterized protein n=1 Tax=Penicillium roqueforti TaxID=5082 RepID=UPI00190A817F|nr:uncharacterized protein LCP9604111_6163 [Penicillium roqueforti]KAF9247464.1 hypothetical protein LCP9604111_6163 [Penicillium roqueforti]KAI1834804.1 hypothetical protein CBS147337_4358 [Penicillium roqueforti]KAI2676647.1 hypothetical protein CBS147355_5749 [Penicillium roqueforti]KAI2683522.1 hypothetical protein LCP963914a_5923 [Penicillium roqueforti]KAI2708345.1 hypothetical protein CBS147332_6406 [Penicillium roqueforti]
MRKPSVGQIVYNATFPRPRPNDPGSFGAHITRNLVPEVRVETSLFYGSLDCIEAQYPGLDYSYGPHRMRLGRFPWHRKLFQTFDQLGLTEEEISNLCRWEGTKSARQRYEAEEGITVQDTTAHSVRPASPQPAPSIEIHFIDCDFCGTEEEDDQIIETQSNDTVRAIDSRASSYRSAEEHEIEEELSDEEMESCGVALNNRILAAMAARDQGTDVPLDEDWEQWLKEAGERGSFGEMVHAIRANQPLTLVADNVRIPRGRGAARVVTRAALFTVPDSIIATNTALPSTSNHASGTAQ